MSTTTPASRYAAFTTHFYMHTRIAVAIVFTREAEQPTTYIRASLAPLALRLFLFLFLFSFFFVPSIYYFSFLSFLLPTTITGDHS